MIIDFENKTPGYILLHRSMLDQPYFTDSHYIHLWIYMLLKCNHSDKMHHGTLIKRGSFKTGRKRIAADTWINESKIERMLSFLESEQQIEQQKTRQYRVIVIVGWDSFQRIEHQNAQQKSTGEQHRTQRSNKSNEVIKESKVFKKPTLEEVKKYCIVRNNSVNHQKFLDHYDANGWVRGKTKIKDWKACVRTWEDDKPVKKEKFV